jgi:hypothetical protein
MNLFKLLYLDPGIGSIIFQFIAAFGALLAIGYKQIFIFIKNIFNKNKDV